MGDVLTRVYRRGALEAEGFPLDDVSDHLARPDTFVWVDISAPSSEQLRDLAGELELHELAVEDALRPHQRPKLDRYPGHFFLSSRAVRIDPGAALAVEIQVDAFLNSRWILTVRQSDEFGAERLVARCDRSADLARFGPGFVLYALLDLVVDDYFTAVEAFDTYYDDIADGIFAEQPLQPSQQRHWFENRRLMVRFHRLVLAMRETVNSLMHREDGILPEGLYPYLRDVYDHVLRVGESTESLRDLMAAILDTNLSLRDYRQNLIVKKVGSWAAIITVAAVITGYYGMNVPYPGAGAVAGVVTSTLLIVLSSVILFILFRRREWL
jgi:magnesium transporter